MDELPIVIRLNEIAAHESGLSPIVKLRDECIADVRQAAALIRAQHEALSDLEAALRRDSRNKAVLSDTVEYHLDGQSMYQAINRARAALAKAREA